MNRPSISSGLQVQTIEREEDLESFLDEWRGLFKDLGQANFFIDPDYLQVWWRHFCRQSVPRVFVLRDDHGLRGVFPLRLSRRRVGPVSLRVMSGMSNWESAKPQWLIRGEAEPAIDAWLNTVLSRRDWDIFHFPDTPLNTPGLPHLWRSLSARGYRWRDVPCEGATVLDASGDFDTYWTGRPKKKRHNMKWALGRIKKAGSVGFEISQPEDDPLAWTERLFDLAGRTWQASEGTGLNQPPRDEFYRDMIRTFLPQGRLKIYILTLDGRDVAFFLGYAQQGVFYVFKTGYDREYQQVYPGLILLKHLLDDCFADDEVGLLDFITSKPLFATWTDATAPLCDLLVYHHTLRGRLMSLIQLTVIPLLKRLDWRRRPSVDQGPGADPDQKAGGAKTS
jgi:CelD/BcsL family acetyltransferase involved in cellulose biosynthesis